MPDQDFYRGLTLPEQIEKFVDHHFDEQNRHISAFEAQMLRQVLVRPRVDGTG